MSNKKIIKINRADRFVNFNIKYISNYQKNQRNFCSMITLHLLIISIIGFHQPIFGQTYITTYEPVKIFNDSKKPISMAVFKLAGEKGFQHNLYIGLKKDYSLKEMFEFISYEVIEKNKKSLGIESLDINDKKVLKKLRKELGIVLILTGNYVNDEVFELKIISTEDGSEVFSNEYRNSGNSTAIKDVIRLFSNNEKAMYNYKKGCTEPINYLGKTYHTIQIRNQCWLLENLDVGRMINRGDNQSENGVIEKYCYNDKTVNCDKYGGLYQWDEAMQYSTSEGAQGICPSGWHIPTKSEFETLKATVNNDGNSLKMLDQDIKSSVNINSSGFSGLLAGYFNKDYYEFNNQDFYAYFWSSSIGKIWGPYELCLWKDSEILVEDIPGTSGRSVRCIKD